MLDGFDVVAEAAVVEGWASRWLPFEPKGWLLDYRTALRAALRRLPRPCPSLYCAYTSAEPSRCDVENVLLYNVGSGAFGDLAVAEVVVERFFNRPATVDPFSFPTDHHHHYRCGQVGAAPAWETIATWRRIPVEVPFKLERLWSSLRAAVVPLVATDPATAHLSLQLELEHPAATRPPAVISAMKVMIDAAIASLHVHDGSSTDELAGRLAARLGGDAPQLAAELMDPSCAVLGRRRLLWPFRGFVQWNPADDGVVWIRVATQPGDMWRISGDLKATAATNDHRTEPHATGA